MSLAPADATATAEAAVTVSGLRVASLTHGVDIVTDVSFAVAKGEALGDGGRVGVGKTTMAMALLGYAEPGTRIADGRVQLGDENLLASRSRGLRRRADDASRYVPQNPPKALSPGMRVGRQVAEMLAVHGFERRRRSRARGASRRLSSRPTASSCGAIRTSSAAASSSASRSRSRSRASPT